MKKNELTLALTASVTTFNMFKPIQAQPAQDVYDDDFTVLDIAGCMGLTVAIVCTMAVVYWIINYFCQRMCPDNEEETSLKDTPQSKSLQFE